MRVFSLLPTDVLPDDFMTMLSIAQEWIVKAREGLFWAVLDFEDGQW